MSDAEEPEQSLDVTLLIVALVKNLANQLDLAQVESVVHIVVDTLNDVVLDQRDEVRKIFGLSYAEFDALRVMFGLLPAEQDLVNGAESDVPALLAEIRRLRAAAREGIEAGIYTALVSGTTGADDGEWIDIYVRPRVDKWTAEIMASKGLDS